MQCIREKMDVIDWEEDAIDAAVMDAMAVTQDHFKYVLYKYVLWALVIRPLCVLCGFLWCGSAVHYTTLHYTTLPSDICFTFNL